MRIFTFLLLMGGMLFADTAPELAEKYQDSNKCKPCHSEKVKEWSGSWHSKSHYNSNEYLRKTMEFVAKKSRRSENSVKVECAVCHNPRMKISETGTDYEIIASLGLSATTDVHRAVNSEDLNEGINCLVCHNVNSIDHDADETVRGADRLKWNPVGVMSGPIDDAKSPYHKTQSRPFFKEDVNQLCLVCHANDRSESGVVFTNMEKEMQSSGKLCADCHMSQHKPGIASNLPIDNGQPKARMVRDHGFVGAHTDWLWEGSMDVAGKKDGENLIITIKNPNPHNLPSGFGGRELLIDIDYKTGSKTVGSKRVSLTRQYISKRGKPTVPHLAVEMSDDASIPANGARAVKVPWVKGAGSATITLSYRLVNDQIRDLLDLKEAIWSKQMFINKAVVRP